jgi:NAD+ diphosphatase
MSPRPDLGPKPRLGYTASLVDRASEKRNDEAFLRALMADERAGVYAIAGEMVVLKAGDEIHDPMFRPDEVAALGPQTETVFLGLVDGAGRFGMGLDPSVVEPLKAQNRFVVTDLRSIAMQGLVAQDHLPPLAEAKAMLHWHARHRFCSNCGAPSTLTEAGWRRDCPACKATHFPRTDPVVIMLAIDGDRCLLGRQTRFVKGMWSCLAGFVEPGETIEEAVRRETREEAGITCGRVRYFATQPWPFPMSLMIGCHAEALTSDIAVDRSELEDARWFDREEAAQMLLRRHPVKLGTPPPVAIAYHIIRAFVEEGDAVLR